MLLPTMLLKYTLRLVTFCRTQHSPLVMSVLTVDELGRVTKVSDGYADVTITIEGYSKKVRIDVASSVAASTLISSEFISGL